MRITCPICSFTNLTKIPQSSLKCNIQVKSFTLSVWVVVVFSVYIVDAAVRIYLFIFVSLCEFCTYSIDLILTMAH